MTSPPPGSILLTCAPPPSRHWQRPLGWLAGEQCAFTHAAIVLDDFGDLMDPWPEPYSAARNHLSDYTGRPAAAFVLRDLTAAQACALACAASSLDGTGYRKRDYLYLAAWRFGLRLPQVRRRLADPAHLTPAQFVAEVYRRAGVPLDGERDLGPAPTVTALARAFTDASRWNAYLPVRRTARPRPERDVTGQYRPPWRT